jgi:uncharacterized protein YbjT (DUF2867 family)
LDDSLKIIIAGASGYIGKALIPKLLDKFPNVQITALSRSEQSSDDQRIIWKACDLFSLKSLEEALPAKADLAFYLVHSMGPTAQLDQGSFADYDLILADNFARAVKRTGLKQLIYLGGLVPESPTLSLHLQSRLEVEETFHQHDLPTTIFRAGLILGEAGSSFQILLKLVGRLPVMVCPRWTQTLTTPVDLMTVLTALTASALAPEHIGKVYDLAGCRPLTYVQMMKETARKAGKKRFFVAVPFFTPTLSRLWVSLITNTSKNLVYPLVESLEHAMIARKDHLFSDEWSNRTYFDLLENASLKTHSSRSLFQFSAQRKTVRSVQRLKLPIGKDAEWIRQQYVHWLPNFLSPVIKVALEQASIVFFLAVRKFVLLEMKLNEERSNKDRQLLYITNGILVSGQNKGRLEFRVVLNRRYVLAAIHDYKPSLPWFIYKFTQAKLHLFVMKAFGRRLKNLRVEQM